MLFGSFWSRVSDRWMTGIVAVFTFSIAAIFVCLITAFFAGALSPHGVGIGNQLAWGAIGVLGPLSCIFLWSGMRRYQQMRGPSDRFGDTRIIRFLMLVGLCWSATLYFLLVFLPYRRTVFVREQVSSSRKSSSDVKMFSLVLAIGWAIFMVFIAALFAFPKAVVRSMHGAVSLIPLVMIMLMLASGAYIVIRFIRGSGGN